MKLPKIIPHSLYSITVIAENKEGCVLLQELKTKLPRALNRQLQVPAYTAYFLPHKSGIKTIGIDPVLIPEQGFDPAHMRLADAPTKAELFPTGYQCIQREAQGKKGIYTCPVIHFT